MYAKLLVIVVLTCLTTFAATAQTTPQNINVIAVQIKPGGQAAFEAFLKRYSEAVAINEDDRLWTVSTNAIGPVTQYTIASPLPSFAALANPPDPIGSMIAAFGEEEAAAVSASLEDAIAETSGRAWIARPDLSRPTDSDDAVVGFSIIYVDIKPGGQAAFEKYVGYLLEASNKLDEANWVLATGAPGAPADYLVSTPIFRWADLDNPEARTLRERMMAAFGEQDGARRYADGVASIENITTSLIRSRPDLSRTTAE